MSRTRPWETSVPKQPKRKNIVRCYVTNRDFFDCRSKNAYSDIIWMTPKEFTLFNIRYPDEIHKEIIEKDWLVLCQKSRHQTYQLLLKQEADATS